MEKESLDDRMKLYEAIEAKRHLIPLLPICCRLDGKCFSSFTRDLVRPFDIVFSQMMIETTKFLVEEANACIGYTESDEISLIIYSDSTKSQVFFDGRIQKLTSVLASLATAKFLSLVFERLPDKARELPVFDCRIWNVPNKDEAANAILFREMDASRNSVSMAASHYYSHKQLNNVTSKEKQELLYKKGVNWNDYPSHFKRGTFIQRKKVLRKFTASELDKLPPKHKAREDPDLVYERSEVEIVSMPPFSTVVNRVGVIFNGEEPVTEKKGNKNE